MNKKILIIHGIGTDGRTNTDKLGFALSKKGYRVEFIKHRLSWWNVRFRIDDIARRLKRTCQNNCFVIGHSAGCLATYEAMKLGATFDKVVFFSAAMGQNKIFPYHGMTKLLNIFCPYDKALTIGSLLPGHKFGVLGRDGYLGPKDNRIINHQVASNKGKFKHTDPYFCDEELNKNADLVDDFLLQ